MSPKFQSFCTLKVERSLVQTRVFYNRRVRWFLDLCLYCFSLTLFHLILLCNKGHVLWATKRITQTMRPLSHRLSCLMKANTARSSGWLFPNTIKLHSQILVIVLLKHSQLTYPWSKNKQIYRRGKCFPTKAGLQTTATYKKALFGSQEEQEQMLSCVPPLIGTHHVVVVVGAPEVRTVAGTEVGLITFGLVDPFPVKVSPKVDVERPQAAALVWAPDRERKRFYLLASRSGAIAERWAVGEWHHVGEPAVTSSHCSASGPNKSRRACGLQSKRHHC